MNIHQLLRGLSKPCSVLLVCLVSLNIYTTKSTYTIQYDTTTEQKQVALKFIEAFSSGNPNISKYLSTICSRYALDSITYLLGDSDVGLPYPIIHNIYETKPNTILVEFDPMVSEYEQFYEYLITFNDDNKIVNIKPEYRYRGKLREEK